MLLILDRYSIVAGNRSFHFHASLFFKEAFARITTRDSSRNKLELINKINVSYIVLAKIINIIVIVEKKIITLTRFTLFDFLNTPNSNIV